MNMLALGVAPKSTRSGFQIKNGSATLFDGNKILVSIAEERLSRKKSDSGCNNASKYILHHVLEGTLPDELVVSTCCEPATYANIDHLDEALLLGNRLRQVPSHHFSHALSAYYLSPFERALVCVVDAGGNTLDAYNGSDWWNAAREQCSLYLAEGANITLLQRWFDKVGDWGIGETYRAFTRFLGLGGQTSSGKLMGLSAYGAKLPVGARLFDPLPDGHLRARLEMATPWVAESAVEDFLRANGVAVEKRSALDPLTPIHSDVARFVQEETETAVLHLLRWATRKHKITSVCIAGGVGLNCPVNTRLLEENIAAEVFVPPCPGDDGQSVGNAIFPFHERAGSRFSVEFLDAFHGPLTDSVEDIQQYIEATDNLEIVTDDATFSTTADFVASGKIVGWFQGRSEIGPRALGHRSILADPRRRDVRVRLSSLIKGRDAFRPYAASIIEEEFENWCACPCLNPYMLFFARLKDHTMRAAPALFHPDKTCRIQTVSPRQSEFYQLLRSFKQRTGLPFLLNTSYNTANMPIVETPKQAIFVLKQTDLDATVIRNQIVCKRRSGAAVEFTPRPTITISELTDDVMRRIEMVYPGVPIARRNYFGLVREYCDWVLTGRKFTTVRLTYGALDLPASRCLEVVARPGDEVVYAVTIKRMRILPFGELSHQDAVRDGFHSVMELRDALKRFYSGVTDLHPVTIYDIDVMEGFESLRGRPVCNL
jgi:carbamoyltransferase